MKTYFVLATALFIGFTSCKKAKQDNVLIQLDVPFEASIGNSYYLKDDIDSNGIMTHNEIKLNITRVDDNRSTGEACSSSYGSSADIYSTIKLNENDWYSKLPMLGCTNNAEWDTTNTNAPRTYFGEYRLFLLKLNPFDAVLDKQEDYTVKYVFKRK